MKDKRCKTCIYWEEIQTTGPVMLSVTSGSAPRNGWCHRYPPKSHVVNLGAGRMQVQNIFPGTEENGWCGEHQKEG